MLPNPYAHTVYWADGRMIVFGEGVILPHLDSVRDEQAAEEPEDEDAGSVIAGDRENQVTSGQDQFYRSTSESTYDGRSSPDRMP
jgi:hypothetical protein